MGFLLVNPSGGTNIPDQPAMLVNSTSANSAGPDSNANPPVSSFASTLAIIPLGTLAGFNWEWVIMIIKRIGDSFKEQAEPATKLGK